MNNFDAAVDAIRASMNAGEITAREGARAIHRILIKQLKSYGISDPEGFINRSEADPDAGVGQTGSRTTAEAAAVTCAAGSSRRWRRPSWSLVRLGQQGAAPHRRSTQGDGRSPASTSQSRIRRQRRR